MLIIVYKIKLDKHPYFTNSECMYILDESGGMMGK